MTLSRVKASFNLPPRGKISEVDPGHIAVTIAGRDTDRSHLVFALRQQPGQRQLRWLHPLQLFMPPIYFTSRR